MNDKIKKTNNEQGYGVMFHHFCNEVHPKVQGAISAVDLENIIKYVGPENILEPLDYTQRACEGKLTRNDYCLTFDDSLLSQFDVALPVLNKYSLKAFWFVYSSVFYGEKEKLEIYRSYMHLYFTSFEEFFHSFENSLNTLFSSKEISEKLRSFNSSEYLKSFPFYTEIDRKFRFIRDEILGRDSYYQVMDNMIKNDNVDIESLAKNLWLKDQHLEILINSGHAVGLHSYSHPTRIAKLSFEAQESEYRKNLEHISSVIGQKPYSMSHPCNSYNMDTINILKILGIKIGFCSNISMKPESIYELPREDHTNILNKIKEG